MNATNPLPINTTNQPCWRCWTPPGQTHELSCDEVTLAQMNAFFAWQDEQQEAYDRWARKVGWSVCIAAVLVAVSAILLTVWWVAR